MSDDDKPWLPEGAIEKATLAPRTALVLREGEGGTWTVAALAGLIDLYPRLVSMLRELEWEGSPAGSECPECEHIRERKVNVPGEPVPGMPGMVTYTGETRVIPGGHAPDCRLDALLRECGK